VITTNSLGKRIAKTDEQIAAFWKWFGKSKVVDEQGRPLVVYHSTDTPWLVFDERKARASSVFGKGIYLSTTGPHWGGGAVMPLYLKSKVPLDITKPASAEALRMLSAYAGRSVEVTPLITMERRDGSVVAGAAKAGFDSIIHIGPGRAGTHIVAFAPTQIKSATGNRGTFDPADASLVNPPRGFSTNPPIPYEPTDLKGMRALKGFRPAAQQHDYTCGPACLRAVLSYYGAHLTEAHLAKVARTTKRHGTTPENMCRTLTACARKTSVKRGATLAWCIKQLRASRPVLLLWNDWKGHWVVLIGYDVTTGRLLFADPANRKTGLRVHTAETLKKYWSAKVAGRAYKRLGIAVT
jgi:hypothetical protein